MRRTNKWLLMLGILLLLPPPFYLLWATSPVWQKYLRLQLPQVGKVNPIFTWYLIIISAVAIVFLIISFFTILCWPTHNKFNLLKRKDGQVRITSKAINGFVASSLTDLPYVNQVKVDSKLTNRHIKIKISGNLGTGENLEAMLNEYLDQMTQNLRKLLGINQKPKITIKFTNFQSTNNNAKRVQ
ncbi:alkaline shock response membrane anchor protein AmaP [Lactobacillus sp. ESL0791]|uniref:alkaline shock response membrane anchor protein AmaP n=1 Tax=Lactobacillus sp. ESL0791 TaxID=2983234 RepID=UPI0023F7C24E|nr:alkaline shock response membrane anchor protein AmaP [Lactobacillus sp. ESL0791]MDF7639851.1 alkaline shock response membrane anchor protein AmaP [Lactobacillus sp. ESL0791]